MLQQILAVLTAQTAPDQINVRITPAMLVSDAPAFFLTCAVSNVSNIPHDIQAAIVGSDGNVVSTVRQMQQPGTTTDIGVGQHLPALGRAGSCRVQVFDGTRSDVRAAITLETANGRAALPAE
jgi:hypothetical protein